MTCPWFVHEMFIIVCIAITPCTQSEGLSNAGWSFIPGCVCTNPTIHQKLPTNTWLVNQYYRSQLLQELFILFSWFVYDLWTTCSQFCHDLLLICSPLEHDLFITSSWLVHYFSLLFNDFYMIFSWVVYDFKSWK